MEKDKHFYIIVGLLLVILILILMVFVEQKKPTTTSLGDARDNLQDCSAKIRQWEQKHAGATVDETGRNELSGILDNCSTLIGK